MVQHCQPKHAMLTCSGLDRGAGFTERLTSNERADPIPCYHHKKLNHILQHMFTTMLPGNVHCRTMNACNNRWLHAAVLDAGAGSSPALWIHTTASGGMPIQQAVHTDECRCQLITCARLSLAADVSNSVSCATGIIEGHCASHPCSSRCPDDGAGDDPLIITCPCPSAGCRHLGEDAV